MPAELQVPHAPHDELQQTPFTQLPEVHAADVAHVEPFESMGAQDVPLQKSPVTQLAAEAQLVGQTGAIPEQTKGAHDGFPGLPEARFAHVPVEQSPQRPHAELQHTPPTQLLE